jgi:hypothetical protein
LEKVKATDLVALQEKDLTDLQIVTAMVRIHGQLTEGRVATDDAMTEERMSIHTYQQPALGLPDQEVDLPFVDAHALRQIEVEKTCSLIEDHHHAVTLLEDLQ